MGATRTLLPEGAIRRAIAVSTFVSVGNATQPFPRLLDAVANMAAELPQPVTVQYGNSAFSCTACRSVDFVAMDSFMKHMQEADLLILHAGAGAIISAMQVGKVPVVVPRKAEYGEHIDNHQLEFARSLAATNRVVVVEDLSRLLAAVEEARLLQARRPPRVGAPALVSTIEQVLAGYAADAGG